VGERERLAAARCAHHAAGCCRGRVLEVRCRIAIDVVDVAIVIIVIIVIIIIIIIVINIINIIVIIITVIIIADIVRHGVALARHWHERR